MSVFMVTGGAGFFGSILVKYLLEAGHQVVSIDLNADPLVHPRFTAIQGDICNVPLMDRLFSDYSFDAVFHLAALLAHVKKDRQRLWASNVEGTRVVLQCAEKFQVGKIIFISSNCLWARNFTEEVDETEPPAPIEIYGRSKWEGEKILLASDKVTCVVFRCPTIMDEGRLGLLGILFAFIDENRRLWIVGNGRNRYQFIYARDFAKACLAATDYPRSTVFNIGSDDVKTFNEVYQYVIEHAGSRSRLFHLPRKPAVWGMKLCFRLGMSPLGPYQYKMIASNFVFDTRKIKTELKWQPTLKNEEMLLKAYDYYHQNKTEILHRRNVSAHSSVASMGIIRLIKWLS